MASISSTVSTVSSTPTGSSGMQADADASASHNGNTTEQLAELKEILKPFLDSLSLEQIGELTEKKLKHATAYEVALIMVFDIITKIDEYIEKRFAFHKVIITNLWNCQPLRHEDSINIIEMLHNFLTLCGHYTDAPFKNATFGARIPNPDKLVGKIDFNYNISQKEGFIPLGKCNFSLLFKVLRAIIGRQIYRCTGKYATPDISKRAEWKYFNGKEHVTGANDFEFVDFIDDLGNIYTELEKFTPDNQEIKSIFQSAGAAAKAEIAAKIEARALREAARAQHQKHQRRREYHKRTNTHEHPKSRGVSGVAGAAATASATTVPSTKTVIPDVPRPPPPPPVSRWGTTPGGAAALFNQ
jgi:hypothetical protein